MADSDETIEQYLRKERFRTIRSWVIPIVCICSVLTCAGVALRPGESREVVGVVAGLHATSSEQGHRLYLQVKLPSGRVVQAKAAGTTSVRKGERARLSEVDYLFGHGSRYRFLAYEPIVTP
jgi:hypothetical protein